MSPMNPEDIRALLDFDRERLWHPYTSMADPLPVYPVTGASGTRLTLADGRELVDGMSSWWCAVHGYGHPALISAAKAQLDKMPHVMFGGITHEPAVDLARKLLERAPPSLEHVFFADSGSVAVEAAIKMALQHRRAAGEENRAKLMTVRGGYHGDTFGAMAVCDPVTGMHRLFEGMLPGHIFAPRPAARFGEPFDPSSLDAVRLLMEEHGRETAAFIIEPIVQGAGGMWFYHPEYLRGLRRLCDEHDVLLIADEIATGFGRTGKYFACEWAGIEPDIMCVGKALTGGVMTLAATLASGKVARGVSAGGNVFMHGPTFMANPLACAVAGASLDLLEGGGWEGQISAIAKWLSEGLKPLAGAGGVRDVRVLGAIGVVETIEPVDVPKLQAFFVEKGVWIRPFANLVYLMPPYVSTEEDIGRLTSAVRAAFGEGIV